jgi:PIN domain nuclease of toxin-antitoxin system
VARLLLDTHVLLWWLDGDGRVPTRIRSLIQDDANEILVSAASVWEITTKARLGKLPGTLDVAADVPGCIRSQGFTALAISIAHAQVAGTLPGPHRDPFDRMLIAQAQTERCPILSIDTAFDDYGVTRIWSAIRRQAKTRPRS